MSELIVLGTPTLRVFGAGTADEQWRERALCAQTDPEAFFPEKGGSTGVAKKICQRCEVRGECLSYALDHDERFGVWGGLSERQRRHLRQGTLPPDVLPAAHGGEEWVVADDPGEERRLAG